MNANIAARLAALAGTQPDKVAIVDRKGGRRAVTYGELAERVARFAGALTARGVAPGARVLLLVPLSIDLYACLLGVLHAGATAVFVDLSGGIGRIDAAVAAARPDAVIGGGVLRLLGSVRRIPVKLGGRAQGEAREACEVAPDAPALVTFTTGSTGAPKATARSHAFLVRQHEVLARHLGSRRADVDLTTLPVFVLNDLAAGTTSVLPGIDPRRPDRANPALVRRLVEEEGVTTLVASPAIVARLLEPREPLRLRALFTGGAPVLPPLARAMVERIDGEAMVLYGSTEVEPVAAILARDYVAALAEEGALGLCAGPPVPELELAIVAANDGPLTSVDPLPRGEVGEVVVAGAHVVSAYLDDPAADARHKIVEGARTWHRTGDAARLDARGRLWLMGRVSQRVERAGTTWWPLPAELAALSLDGVRHAAYFGTEDAALGMRAVLCVEGASPSLGQAQRALAPWPVDQLIALRRIPRDVRHHSKTDLPRLRQEIRKALPRA